jgi:cathepsin L
MRKFIFGAWLLATSGSSWANSVEINGVMYHTGLLPRPINLPANYRQDVEIRSDLPDSYDAREHGLVTPIKNQGQCGSCWAFARTKAMEAALILSGRDVADVLNLAEQDPLVNDRNSFGCNGGFMDGRFEVAKGVTTEDLCPYRASSRYACSGKKHAKATTWSMVGAPGRAPSVDELRQAIVDHGVIAVTVAAGNAFSPDANGRIKTCSNGRINHMVTLAGYRPAPNGGYEFLIGNSWGTNWGDGGFAWSKQGCNRLASTPGDAALYFEVSAQ